MNAKILLVDDDRAILRSLERLLGGQGYHVSSTVSAEEAWLIVNREPIDLMILDLSLPGQDGLTLCRRIRARWQFPILMVTARGESADKVLGLELGADDYLVKPFEPPELLARVRAQLELLHLLARHRGKAMSKDYLFETVWGYDAELATKALAVYVRRLRQKIEADPDAPRYLVTVRGFGYKLVNPDAE
jgi:DNA-binding response OmpR family regulator